MNTYDLSWLRSMRAPIERYSRLPRAVQGLIDRSLAEVDPIRIYAFGSRVRGDFGRHSDLDFGFELHADIGLAWARFFLEEPERTETLLHVDLVGLHECSDSLKKHILEHGVVIYERAIGV